MVSVIIPCRNEEKFIRICLDSIIANDYPKDRLEVLVVDGMSEDGTREIVEKYARRHTFIKLVKNPKKITPAAMNAGSENAKGAFIAIMSAHSEYPPNYLVTAIEYLRKTRADVVGGPVTTKPAADTLIARSIALATSHPFGVGNSSFRTSSGEGYVDTVPFGIYRRDVFSKVGLFDERLVRNQDNELSARIIKSGGKIYLTPQLTAYYYNQATVSGLLKQALKTGMWNVVTLKVNLDAFRWRHFIPFVFVTAFLGLGFLTWLHSGMHLAFLVLVGLYGGVAIVSSLQIGFKNGMKYAPLLPMVFFLYHTCYGLGTWAGLLRVAIAGWGGGSDSSIEKQHRPAKEGNRV